MASEWRDPPVGRDDVGNKRKKIKNGAPVYRGQARGSQSSGAHASNSGGCRALALALIGAGSVLLAAAGAGAVELVRMVA